MGAEAVFDLVIMELIVSQPRLTTSQKLCCGCSRNDESDGMNPN